MKRKIGVIYLIKIILLFGCTETQSSNNSDVVLLIERMMYGMDKSSKNVFVLTRHFDPEYLSSAFLKLSSYVGDSTYSYCYKKLSENVGNNPDIEIDEIKSIFPSVVLTDDLSSKLDNGLVIYFSKIVTDSIKSTGVQFCEIYVVKGNMMTEKRNFIIYFEKRNNSLEINQVVLRASMGGEIDLPFIGNGYNKFKDWETGVLIQN